MARQRTIRGIKATKNCDPRSIELTAALGPAPVSRGRPALSVGVDDEDDDDGVGFGGINVAVMLSVVVLLPDAITTAEPPGASEIVSPAVVMTPPGVKVWEPMTI
jgi:hypothetical protein